MGAGITGEFSEVGTVRPTNCIVDCFWGVGSELMMALSREEAVCMPLLDGAGFVAFAFGKGTKFIVHLPGERGMR